MKLYLCAATFFMAIAINSFAMETSGDLGAHSNVLCADVGGTRIKAAVLRAGMSLDELKNVDVITMFSEGWLNESLPELFDKNTRKGLGEKIEQSYDFLSFGITGPVMNSRLYINPYRFSIPRELAKRCEDVLHVPVSVENDTTMWAQGALYWQKLTKNEIQFPCLCVTLGSGVGVALLTSPYDITLLEISFLNTPFTRLHELSKDQPVTVKYGIRSPHQPIGRAFFEWARTCSSWDEKTIQDVFNNRVVAFCEDMQEFLAQEMDITLKNILIGGGNSRFILRDYLQDILKKKIVVLSPENIAGYGISPDIISLLGCVCSSNNISVCSLPPLEIFDLS